MSVIRKKPFIEMVIDSLSPAMKDALAGVLNNQPATINRNSSFADMPSVNTVTAVYFKLDETNFKNGILIYNNSYCVLVAYHRFQDLLIYQLNVAAKQYTKINEYLDINELRRVLNDRVGKDIDAGEIDSGEALAGQVLAADGAGGASWENTMDTITPETVQSGDAVQLFGFDAQGNLVKDDMPEGITVDQSVIEDSTNAVAGGAVYDELAPMKEDITDLEAEMETKANVDGNYPTMTVGVADQLSPYDDESGDDQDEPFSFQATGTGNGSQPDFSTGAIALMKEKQGNTVVVNQLFPLLSAGNVTITDADNCTCTRDSNGVYTLTVTATVTTNGYIYMGNITPEKGAISGHRYLVLGGYSSLLRVGYQSVWSEGTPAQGIMTFGSSISPQIRIGAGLEAGTYKLTPKFINLTRWFNGDIPQDLLDNPENFFRYYQGSLAYNEGELVNANGRYIKCIGMNQWDEETENGALTEDGTINPSASSRLTTSFIKVIPNATYYLYSTNNAWVLGRYAYYDENKNLIEYNGDGFPAGTTSVQIPSNVSYLRVTFYSAYGSTYRHDTSINLYYEDEARCLTYEPYEVLTNNDTGTEVLRSAGSVKDYKEPDGTIHRLVGVVNLGSNDIEWIYDSVQQWFYTLYFINLVKKPSTNDNKANALCHRYVNVARQNIVDKQMCFNTNGYFVIKDSAYNDATAFKTAMSGVYLFYELATPTTEQGTSFSENLVIDDFGSMDFQGTNGVPQGNLIFYPVDYKAFIDTLYDYTEGTPSNIALKSDLPTAPQTFLESITGYDATKTQTLKNVNGTLTWVDDE